MSVIDSVCASIERHPLRYAALGWGIALYLLGIVVGLLIGRNA